jgi:hypothetical protein
VTLLSLLIFAGLSILKGSCTVPSQIQKNKDEHIISPNTQQQQQQGDDSLHLKEKDSQNDTKLEKNYCDDNEIRLKCDKCNCTFSDEIAHSAHWRKRHEGLLF